MEVYSILRLGKSTINWICDFSMMRNYEKFTNSEIYTELFLLTPPLTTPVRLLIFALLSCYTSNLFFSHARSDVSGWSGWRANSANKVLSPLLLAVALNFPTLLLTWGEWGGEANNVLCTLSCNISHTLGATLLRLSYNISHALGATL